MAQCPECNSQKTWKDGVRKTKYGHVQRYLCRDCGFRFSSNVFSNFLKKSDVVFKGGSELPDSGFDSSDVQPVNFLSRKKPQNNSALMFGEDVGSHDSKPQFSTTGKSINSFVLNSREHQVCANKGAKNLNPTTEIKTVVGDKKSRLATLDPTIKGKILEYEFWMQKQGYVESTIRLNRTCLKMLIINGANLLDPESVKLALTKYKASQNRKRNVINAYTQFLKLNGMTWEKPKCKITRKFPFIPLEKEIDALISGSGPKTATFLQLLKETAMRCGEAKRIEWTDIDFEKGIITLNNPEKGSNARKRILTVEE